MAFILDNFVHTGQKSGDEYCPHSARVLMASLASAFENPQAQLQVVEEIKQALHRATVLPESHEKHERISALANIVSTFFCVGWKQWWVHISTLKYDALVRLV